MKPKTPSEMNFQKVAAISVKKTRFLLEKTEKIRYDKDYSRRVCKNPDRFYAEGAGFEERGISCYERI